MLHILATLKYEAYVVIINSLGYDKKPTVLNDKNFVDVSKIASDEEKAKAIVDALTEFDLRNNK